MKKDLTRINKLSILTLLVDETLAARAWTVEITGKTRTDPENGAAEQSEVICPNGHTFWSLL